MSRQHHNFIISKGDLLMTRLTSISRTYLLAAAATIAMVSLPEPAALAANPAQSSSSLSRAQNYFNRSDYRSAVIELRNALRANPNNAQARLLNAQVFIRLQQGIAAQTEVEAARKAGIPKDQTRTLMAEAMVLQRRYTDALEEGKAELVPVSYAAEAARIRGLAQLGLDQPDKAKAELFRAQQLDPRNVRVKLDLARYYATVKDRKSAEAAVDQALQFEPTNTKALVMKGDFTRSSKGLEKALPLFNQALQIDPNNLEALLERAATLTDLRRDKEAQADLTKIQSLSPDHPLSFYLQAVMAARARNFPKASALMARTKGVLDNYPPALLLQGVIAYEANNAQQAQTYLNKLLQQAPDSALGRRLYGASLLRNGDADGAINAIKPLLDKGAPDARLLALMASAYARKGAYNEAETYLEKAVTLDPRQAQLRSQLAMTRVAQGDNATALRDLQTVLKEDPKSLQALMLSALVNMRNGDFKAGYAAAQRLVTTYPDLAIGYNMRGAALLGQSNFKGAEADFRLALQKKPDYQEARRNLAQLLAATKRYDDARRELQKVLESDRGNVRALIQLANIASVQGKNQERVEWLRKAAASDPQSLEPRAQLIQAYLSVGDTSRALTEAASLERDFPENPSALELIGRAQGSANRFGEASRTFERLSRIVPDSVGARLLWGRALLSDKRTVEARRVYQRAMAIKNQDLSPILLDLMQLEVQDGKVDQAILYGNQLKRDYPKRNTGDFALGNLYMSVRQYDKAVAAFDAARKIQYTKPLAINLSQAYYALGKPDQAVATLRAYQKLAPNDVGMRIAVSDIYMRTKQYNQALAEYRSIGPSINKNPIILNNMAFIYGVMNDKRGVQLAEQANKLAPNVPEIIDTLGYLTIKQRGDAKRGLALIKQALAKRPTNPDIRYHYAYALRANGQAKEATAELQKLLAQYKTFDSANEARALLQQIKSSGR